jgi:hypothetical protein
MTTIHISETNVIFHGYNWIYSGSIYNDTICKKNYVINEWKEEVNILT